MDTHLFNFWFLFGTLDGRCYFVWQSQMRKEKSKAKTRVKVTNRLSSLATVRARTYRLGLLKEYFKLKHWSCNTTEEKNVDLKGASCCIVCQLTDSRGLLFRADVAQRSKFCLIKNTFNSFFPPPNSTH